MTVRCQPAFTPPAETLSGADGKGPADSRSSAPHQRPTQLFGEGKQWPWPAPLPLTWALAREYGSAPDGHRAKPQATTPEARLGAHTIPGRAGRDGRRLLCPQLLVRAGRRWRESQPLLRAPTKASN